MSDEHTQYIITDPVEMSVTVVSVQSDHQDTVEVIEHVCSKCEKVYRNFGSLQKHFPICGQPKKKRGSKRKSDEEPSPTKEPEEKVKKEKVAPSSTCTSSSAANPVDGRGIDKEKGEEKEEDPPVYIEVQQVSDHEENEESRDLCYCCDESRSTAHTGHVKCKFCSKAFHSYMGRDKHTMNMHNSSEEFRCNKCPVQCANAEILAAHLDGHSAFVCNICGTEFTRRYHLDRHREKSKCGSADQDKEEHACDVCGRKFLRLDNLREHLRGHMGMAHRGRDHVCQICNKAFFGQSMLQIHIRSHTGERPFACDLCEKAFPSSGALRKHRRVHTGEKPYECSYCKGKFSAKETLNRHLRTHTGEKGYKCEICGIAYIQKTQLKNHMFHHTGEFGEQCPHCDQKFENKASMSRHVKSKHKMQVKCPKCPAEFGTEDQMMKHQELMHNSNKRFLCEDCCVEFPTKAELLEHIVQCVGPKAAQPVLKCGDCGKEYKRFDLLLKHQRSHQMGDKAVASTSALLPKKKGRPKKVVAADQEVNEGGEAVQNSDEIFNQLKNNLDATTFTEQCPLEMSPVKYRTERALKKVLEQILKGLLDAEILKKIGWPKSGVNGTLDAVLKLIGLESTEDCDVDPMTRLRDNMMALVGLFIGKDQLEGMMNNYTVDQILHYMAESVCKTGSG